jgi:hypothetical protein
VYNNVVFNGSYGISAYTGGHKEVFNNTVYNMSMGGIVSDQTDGNVAKNNIVYNPTPAAYGDIFSWADNDTTTYASNLCARPDRGCTMVADPLFVDAANGDFHLQSGSPAIDAAGSGWDIGAHQYGDAATENTCGDDACNGAENCRSCERDCGACPTSEYCGD